MFVLKILGKVREKIKIKLLRFFQGSIMISLMMVNYEEAVILTNTHTQIKIYSKK